MEELERAIHESKRNKASGEDDIPYEFLNNLGSKAKELLLFLYNKCWEGNGIPTKWKTAIIVFLECYPSSYGSSRAGNLLSGTLLHSSRSVVILAIFNSSR